MIEIGLAGWGDHDSLYTEPGSAKNKLTAYSRWFSCVEVDSTFYAIQPLRNMEKWTAETPPAFRFIVKAYQGMTGHTRGPAPQGQAVEDMFAAFRASIAPMIEAGKLRAVLFQYPPWFDCTKANVQELRETRARMEGIPCALEFRHQSWFEGGMAERTLDFMRSEGWYHTVCDEPQAGKGSVPIVEAAAAEEMTLVRFHGRNVEGWHSSGQPNWREVRYLYDYNETELADWSERLKRLETMTDTVSVIFNNNSGGHASANALEMMMLLGQTPPRGSFEVRRQPEQLELFAQADEIIE
ncbi:DUF72 domain-containing protein [Paenibacillus sambharensis]|uniref:DUF72 domain-containing protein n=1 Tax=Paenibacillus sambharensis TaxID=1803190 RepID=A0A2W1M1H1_9BACL|nr:DUF72 domain-containing protein [Paenibacillus sambharensis]PZD97761.1 DUF72 domain-containing protein [Paenibacillus sambharensis]